jgi:peptidoglycan/xylan/chitin deacetylase (PgdA/CDA1 family)
VLKPFKLAALAAMRGAGFDDFLLQSEWRRKRLLIVCFHGVSMYDEHQCYPGFFLPEEDFRRKLQLIRDLDLTVLPLDEAVARLSAGTLPPRSITITIDDGFYAAYVKAAPVLAEFGYPATVYLTTHYIHYDRAPFDNICGYVLWKGRGRQLKSPRVFASPALVTGENQPALAAAIYEYARINNLNSAEKDELAAELAGCLGIDYEDLRRKRLFHLVRPDEIRSWKNVDFQLHTHRHRVSRDKATFQESVRRNASELRIITGTESRHFAYPSGAYLPEHEDWLRELGILSGATCVTGIATRRSNVMFLPRVMDTAHLRPTELAAWMTGCAALLPTKSYPIDLSQLEGPA